MTGAARLTSAMTEFGAIIEALAAIAIRRDAERRVELIKLRRQLSDHIGSMRDLGSQAFTDPALAEEFRSRLSTVLNVVALHQANWPAVAIDERQEDYHRSARAVAAGNRAFIEWTRAALARQG